MGLVLSRTTETTTLCVGLGLYACMYLYVKLHKGKCHSKKNLEGKTIIVTGANSGNLYSFDIYICYIFLWQFLVLVSIQDYTDLPYLQTIQLLYYFLKSDEHYIIRDFSDFDSRF